MLATLQKWIAWLLAWLKSCFQSEPEPIQGEPVMSALSIQPTYPIFTDIDGQPLEDGFVWIGQANLDPQVNPINVFWDAALTIPAGQPIRTLGGYPSNSGTPARLYVNSDYSIRVMNKNGSVVYSAPAATERYSDVVVSGINAQDVVYDPPFASAVQTNQEEFNARYISVKDFGAVGDGVTDDSAAIQAALNSIQQWTNVATTPVPGNSQSVGGGVLYFPPTSAGYRIATAINVTKTVVKFVGPARLYIDPGVTGFLFNYPGASAKTGVVFERLDFTGGSYGVNTGDQNVWAPASFYNCTFVNQTDAGIRIGAFGFSYAIRDCLFTGCKHGIYTVGSASDNLLIDHCMFIYNSNYDIYISENNTITIRSCNFVGNQFTPAASAANIFISMDSSTETAGYSSIIGNKFGQEGRTAGYCIYVTGTSSARLTALVVRDNLMHFESSTGIGHGIKLNNVNAYGLVVENNSLTYCQLIDYSTSSTTERNGENVIGENTVVTGGSWSQLLRGNYNILDHIEPATFNKYNLLKWSRYINDGASFTYTNATPSYMTAADENGVANNATTVLATAANNVIRYNALETNNQQKFYSLSIWMKLDSEGSVAFQISRGSNYVLSRSINVGMAWQRVTIEFYQTYLGAGFPYSFDIILANGSTITLGGVCLVAGRDVGDLRRSDTTIEYPGGRIQAALSPVSGINWRVGDIAWENTPVAGQPIGWACTVAGNPGTWAALANL